MLRKFPDDPQDLAGQFRVQCGGRLVKAENVRVHCQSTGDGHPLLLAAGKLVRIVACPVGQTHLGQQHPAFLFDLLFALAAPFLCQQFPGKRNVLKGSILRKQVKILKYQAKVEPLCANLLLLLGGGVSGVEDDVPIDGNGAAVWFFQEIQAPQQGGLAAAGGTDDGQGLSFFQGKADIIQNASSAEMLFDVINFQNRHIRASFYLK